MSSITNSEKTSVTRITPSGSFNKLPAVLHPVIYEYLDLKEVVNVYFVSKASDEAISKPTGNTTSLKDRLVYRDFAFNSIDWKTHCEKDVDKGEEIPGIYNELNQPCSIRRRVGHIYTLTLIPKGLTLNNFGSVFKKFFPRNPNGYHRIDSLIVTELGEKEVVKSRWVLMTVMSEKNSSRLLGEKAPYEVAETLDAVVCSSAKYFKIGHFPSPHNAVGSIYEGMMLCEDQINGTKIIVDHIKKRFSPSIFFQSESMMNQTDVALKRKFGS